MSVTIYVEGGGSVKSIKARFREGLTAYCRKVAPVSGALTIVPCGGRSEAYDKFRIAVEMQQPEDRNVLLVDSEGPMPEDVKSEQFLSQVTEGRWKLAVMSSGRVFLMVQTMEAWLLADREALALFFGAGFTIGKLAGRADRVESIAKDDLQRSLVEASRSSRRGKYEKGEHSFDLLKRIDPLKVEAGSPRAAEFHKFLREL